MGKLFGTDGVRGVANSALTPEMALQIGRAVATVLTKHGCEKPEFLIGMDTRISGDMLCSSLAAGLCSVGANAILLGVVPTPAVAHLVVKYGATAGFVISASHNPVEFNGIKVFSGDGFKLPDDVENEIEQYVLDPVLKAQCTVAKGDEVGKISVCNTAAADYVAHITKLIKTDLSGLNIAVDCANGAASETAKLMFEALSVKCTFIGAEPNGKNINDGCGSTHLDKLAEFVKKGGYDGGIAFDGDADRCLCVDEQGGEIDGDRIIAIFAKHLKQDGKLAKNTAVVTVMSNLGFIKYCKSIGVTCETTAVGDRYVLENMKENGFSIGGEQSGHIILLEHSTTGDGELTAALLLEILAKNKCKFSELSQVYEKFPQVLKNIKTTQEGKAKYKNDEYVEGFIEAQQQMLMGDGRVLVRLSGTEPLIRVMVEGKEIELITQVAQRISDKIIQRIN